MQYTWNYSSPLGEVVLAANGDKLVGLFTVTEQEVK